MAEGKASGGQAAASVWSPRTNRGLAIATGTVSVAMAGYHMLSTQRLLVDAIQHQNIHLFFALTLVYLLRIKHLRKKAWLPVLAGLLAASIVATGYIAYFYGELQVRAGYQTIPDVIIGTLIIIVAFEACRDSFGLVLPLVAAVFFLYAWLGHLLPGFLYHYAIAYPRVITTTVLGFQSGLYGTVLAVSANYIFLFVLFGGLIQVSGAPKLFMELGKLVGRRLRGGPAQTAVVSSCLVGMVTGSAVANVAAVGPFTIPLMKKVGYPPHVAGGIEAAASTGSQVMPPIMGATAFVLVGIIGIPYAQLVGAAFITGFLYFLAIGLYCEFQARRLKIAAPVEKVDYRLMAATAPIFVVPLSILMVLLLRGYSAMFAIFWGIIACVALGFIVPQARPRLKDWFAGFQSGVISGARIATACATVGIVMGVMLVTGLGLKLSAQLAIWSLGNLWLAAIIAMIMCLILGMGLPPLAAYLMVAIMAAPVFLRFEIPLLQSHFFVFYFSTFSMLTPPVAMAGLVASQLANSDYFKTSWEGFKIAIPAFLMPYVFLVNPSLLGRFPGLWIGVVSIFAMLPALVCLAALVTRHYLVKVNGQQMLVVGASFITLLFFTITMEYPWFFGGVVLFILVTLWQYRDLAAEKAKTTILTEPAPRGR